MRLALTYGLLLCGLVLHGQPPAEFDFVTTPSSGTMIAQATVDGVAASASDWIAGFDQNGQCVGATQVIVDGGLAYFQLTLYGDDETTPGADEGMDEGELFSLRLYDASEDTLLLWTDALGDSLLSGWTHTNGAPIPALNTPSLAYEFGTPVFGCTDPTACNFDPLATIDDGNCDFTSCLCQSVWTLTNTWTPPHPTPATATFTFEGSADNPVDSVLVHLSLSKGCYGFLPADLIVQIDAPNGQSATWGAFLDFDAEATQAQWPDDWSSYPGYGPGWSLHDATVNLSTYGLGGDGTWVVTVSNDYLSWGYPEEIQSFQMELTLDGVCNTSSGCLDSLACNFDATAGISDPASCVFDCSGCRDESASDFQGHPLSEFLLSWTSPVTGGSATTNGPIAVGDTATFTMSTNPAAATLISPDYDEYNTPQNCDYPYELSGYDCSYYDYSYSPSPVTYLSTCSSQFWRFDEQSNWSIGYSGGQAYSGTASGILIVDGGYSADFDSTYYGACPLIYDNGSHFYLIGTSGQLVMELRTWQEIDGYSANHESLYSALFSVNANQAAFNSLFFWGGAEYNPTYHYGDREWTSTEIAACMYPMTLGCTDESACNFHPAANSDDGSCEYLSCYGCTDISACNYCYEATIDDGGCDYTTCAGCWDLNACNGLDYNSAYYSNYIDDGSCLYLDSCGVCGGPGAVFDCGCSTIPDGDCDCDGNQLDAIGVCGGACAADVDEDGICDDVDVCVGSLDACGVCNGPGAVFDCGCADIPEGDCDCNGNQLDAVGVCGGDCVLDSDGDGVCDTDEIAGCTDETACNYAPDATDDDGNCLTLDALGECGGTCAADADADGLCDDVDDCIGAYDDCGVCNGPGAIYECGCNDIPQDDCDCNGNQLDALGVCGGTCAADEDADGICDDVDDCVGAYDECGVCNGPGAVLDCGCDPIPEGDCDCDGNVADIIGVCGGDCTVDFDGDGVCDDAEVIGCTYPDACNFDPLATNDDGFCIFPDAGLDCAGNCLLDADGDGTCDAFEIPGCTDSSAVNFHPAATEEDGTCNFDVTPSCYGDLDNDGIVGVSDILDLLSNFGAVCDP